MTFNKWLDTLLDEKRIDTQATLTVEGQLGTNYIPVACLVEAIKATSANERAAIKRTLVRLDFMHQPILPYLAHLARAIAL